MSVKMPRGFATTPVGGSQAVDTTKKTGSTRRVGFGDAMRIKDAAVRPADPVRVAVTDVAREVSQGRIARGEPAINAVIHRIVAASASPNDSPAAIRARVTEVQATLSQDPNFTTRVNRRLDQAIEALSEA